MTPRKEGAGQLTAEAVFLSLFARQVGRVAVEQRKQKHLIQKHDDVAQAVDRHQIAWQLFQIRLDLIAQPFSENQHADGHGDDHQKHKGVQHGVQPQRQPCAAFVGIVYAVESVGDGVQPL